MMLLVATFLLWITSAVQCDSATMNAHCVGSSSVATTKGWRKEAYPDPIQDPRACRTDSGRFCDPDTLLKDWSDVRRLKRNLQVNRTYALPCTGPRAAKKDWAVSFSLALVKKVSRSFQFFRFYTCHTGKANLTRYF